jgi:hypothetical protein
MFRFRLASFVSGQQGKFSAEFSICCTGVEVSSLCPNGAYGVSKGFSNQWGGGVTVFRTKTSTSLQVFYCVINGKNAHLSSGAIVCDCFWRKS